jgi:transposase
MLSGWGHGRKSKFSSKVRERAVRLVLETQAQHESEWAAIASVASKIGCGPETLRKRLRRTQVDSGKRAGTTSAERERLKELERQVRELKRANEILRKASAYLPRRSSTADRSDGGVHRRTSAVLRGRVDLQSAADRPWANNKLVTAEDGGASSLTARATAIGSWEMLQRLATPTVLFRFFHSRIQSTLRPKMEVPVHFQERAFPHVGYARLADFLEKKPIDVVLWEIRVSPTDKPILNKM